MQVEFKELHKQILATLFDIRNSLDRLDDSMDSIDKRVRANEKEIVRVKTMWSLLATMCGVLGAALMKYL